MRRKSVGAFFDFDKTLLMVESPKLGIRYLWDKGMISAAYVAKILFANFFYKRNLISDETMTHLLLTFYRNKPLELFQAGADDYYHDIIKPHLAPGILARVHKHAEQDHVLILISAGIRYLLEPVVKDLEFDFLICTELETGPDGLLTGRAKGPVCSGINKKQYASRLAHDLDLDLLRSFAYGNHHSDIPMLEMVGNPHAVEPNDILRKIAKERNWPILTYC
ncbi:MAG TPA: HAD-IB family hydrolase [Deltaproteobacteria bacterium]|nr:HAD-IB family hydrolase [Deltaproteobacteria bacterium]